MIDILNSGNTVYKITASVCRFHEYNKLKDAIEAVICSDIPQKGRIIQSKLNYTTGDKENNTLLIFTKDELGVTFETPDHLCIDVDDCSQEIINLLISLTKTNQL